MTGDPALTVRWIAAADNAFGVEVLDCRDMAERSLSTTTSQDVADAYARLRWSDGAEHRGQSPENSLTFPCDLRYPHAGPARDGPLFKAEVMEDKWDIYLYDGFLYFARSWTGMLILRATTGVRDGLVVVTAVEANASALEPGTGYPVAVVDYLIRSHLYRQTALHPLPSVMRGWDALALAEFSFSQYGRHGVLGSFADTTRLNALASNEGN